MLFMKINQMFYDICFLNQNPGWRDMGNKSIDLLLWYLAMAALIFVKESKRSIAELMKEFTIGVLSVVRHAEKTLLNGNFFQPNSSS